MPCSYYGYQEPASRLAAQLEGVERDRKKLVKEANWAVKVREEIIHKLSVRVDMLQELIVKYGKTGFPAEVLEEIEKEQVEHRKDDLARLSRLNVRRRSYSKKPYPKNFKKIVAAADPHFPLEPQLGFNPDDY